MKKTILILFVFLTLLVSSLIQADEQFAPKADIPKNPKNDPGLNLSIMFLKNVKIPTKKEVGLPAYPNSKIIQTDAGSTKRLPMVRLLALDEPSKVAAYYKKALSDWKYKEFFGTHSFWKGEEEEAMMGKVPNVQIGNADSFNKVMPSAKTAIGIWYQSKN